MRWQDELLGKAIEGSEGWLKYLSSLSLGEIKAVSKNLSQKIARYEQLVEDLQNAVGITEAQIRKREEELEGKRRKARRIKLQLSLRQFLSQPLLETDISLNRLALCTKTGASVLLEGLVFKIDSKEQKATTANEAKQFYKQDHEPWAGFNLHYIRDGQISAGYGWDRPFLDEIFL